MATLVLFMLLLLQVDRGTPADSNDSKQEQRIRMFEAWSDCHIKINKTEPPQNGLYCKMVFDDIMCWDYTPAGQLAKQSCPDYISGFYTEGTAERQCMPNGEWFVHPDYNKTWTNFHGCHQRTKDPHLMVIGKHLDNVQLLARIGYSISLAFLLFAVFIMIYFKKLHCQRNTIHVNLFLSCILRAGVCLLKEVIMVQGMGLPMDIEYNQNGEPVFIQEGTHWQCKLLFTIFHYSLCTNYMWVSVEGLYLHNLIFFTVFSQKTLYLVLYIILGWLSPLLIIFPWVIVRILKENTLCWNTHDSQYYWILKGPIIASICINCFFFLNIIRVLFTKLMTSITREPQRYRKLAKSTLVLIPLFGVQYILFISMEFEMSAPIEVVKLYTEMFLNSFLGTIVTILFCFLNGEVKTEIRKFWSHHRFGGLNNFSRPSLRNFNTTSSFVGRERGGSDFTQSVAMVEMGRGDSRKCSPIHNGDVKNKNCNGSANGDLNSRNIVSENTSLINSVGQGEQLPKDRSDHERQLSTNSENKSLLKDDVTVNRA